MSVPVLETTRLLLREMSLADLDFVAGMLADPQVMRFYTRCYSRDEAATWIRRQMERYELHGHGLWLAIDKDSAQPVGQVGLVVQNVEGTEEPEIGYLLHHPFWHCGLATEAASGVRDYAFGVLDKPRVVSLIRPENLPSQAVALRIGLSPEPRLVKHAGLDHRVFSLDRRITTA
jgi:RimJ/RimL family protein N-acetyltransferase